MGKNNNHKNKEEKKQLTDICIFKVILGARLYCFHSRGEKDGNQGENRLKGIFESVVGLKIPISDMHGLTSRLNQAA